VNWWAHLTWSHALMAVIILIAVLWLLTAVSLVVTYRPPRNRIRAAPEPDARSSIETFKRMQNN